MSFQTFQSFPNIQPSSRSYTPGSYPQTEFISQNGAKSVIRYGNKKTDAKLSLGFTNITDFQANQILDLYDAVNRDYDYIFFGDSTALAGINDTNLRNKQKENDNTGIKLRYRFDGPPTVTSVRPGISNVQCKFVACLDGD
tara:strand:- start:9994 stop:10416 length:423 start_codon:yes stop_codon:yes gene_type:complete